MPLFFYVKSAADSRPTMAACSFSSSKALVRTAGFAVDHIFLLDSDALVVYKGTKMVLKVVL
jgi:hypothetical protein